METEIPTQFHAGGIDHADPLLLIEIAHCVCFGQMSRTDGARGCEGTNRRGGGISGGLICCPTFNRMFDEEETA